MLGRALHAVLLLFGDGDLVARLLGSPSRSQGDRQGLALPAGQRPGRSPMYKEGTSVPGYRPSAIVGVMQAGAASQSRDENPLVPGYDNV